MFFFYVEQIVQLFRMVIIELGILFQCGDVIADLHNQLSEMFLLVLAWRANPESISHVADFSEQTCCLLCFFLEGGHNDGVGLRCRRFRLGQRILGDSRVAVGIHADCFVHEFLRNYRIAVVDDMPEWLEMWVFDAISAGIRLNEVSAGKQAVDVERVDFGGIISGEQLINHDDQVKLFAIALFVCEPFHDVSEIVVYVQLVACK